MFGELALPRVGDVDEAVRRLDNGRIAELGLRLIFQDHRGLPGDAVLADREVQRASTLGGMIIDQEMASVLQGDGIRARVRIGQIDEFDLGPASPLVARERAEDLAVAGPTQRHERAVLQEQDAGLDRSRTALPLVDFDFLPGDPVVAATLEMDLPRGADLQAFGAAAGKDRAILQLHGLVLDRAEDAFRQTSRLTPGLAIIITQTKQAPPFDRVGADLIVKLQGTFLGLEQDRIPTRETFTVRLQTFGYLDRRRPFAVDLTRHPDGDIRLTFGFAREPCGDQRPVTSLDDRGGVTAGDGIRLEDELRTDQPWLGAEESKGQEKRDAKQVAAHGGEPNISPNRTGNKPA